MKKLISVLLVALFSFFTISGAQAARTGAPAVTQNTVAKAQLGGHWEIWCVYNEKTGEFELVCVWVEDDDEK